MEQDFVTACRAVLASYKAVPFGLMLETSQLLLKTTGKVIDHVFEHEAQLREKRLALLRNFLDQCLLISIFDHKMDEKLMTSMFETLCFRSAFNRLHGLKVDSHESFINALLQLFGPVIREEFQHDFKKYLSINCQDYILLDFHRHYCQSLADSSRYSFRYELACLRRE